MGAVVQAILDSLEERVLGKVRRYDHRRDGEAEATKARGGDGCEQRVLGETSALQIVEATGHEIAAGIGREVKHRQSVIPRFFARKASLSATSSIALAVGLPAPWPAEVSTRMRMGAGPACAACIAAMYL